MANVGELYAEQLERWEQKAYDEGYGFDWLGELGETIKFYAMECGKRHRAPTFKGLMLRIQGMAMEDNNGRIH